MRTSNHRMDESSSAIDDRDDGSDDGVEELQSVLSPLEEMKHAIDYSDTEAFRNVLHRAHEEGVDNVSDLLDAAMEGEDRTLHYLLRSCSWLEPAIMTEMVQIILDVCPHSAVTATTAGLLPLHLAASSDFVPLKALQRLVDAYPAALTMTCDKHGYVPLHFAIQSYSLEVVSFLLQQSPEAARIANKNENLLPLDLAIRLNRVEEAKLLIEAYPESVSLLDQNGYCTLDRTLLSISSDPLTCEMFEILADASDPFEFQSTYRPPNAKGWHAIHCAARYRNCRLDMFQALLKRWPQAVSMADKKGNLPIHLAVMPGIEFPNKRNGKLHFVDPSKDNDKHVAGMVRLLLEANPSSIQQPNRDGMLPLHLAVDADDPRLTPVVTMLMDEFPQALETRNRGGFLPLHICILNLGGTRAGRILVDNMVDRCSKSLEITGPQGCLAVHLAAGRGDPLDLVAEAKFAGCDVDELVEWISSGYHDYEPLVLALAGKYEEGLETTDFAGLLPLHHALSCFGRRGNMKMEAHVISMLIHDSPYSTTMDHEATGQLCLHFAVSECIMTTPHEVLQSFYENVLPDLQDSDALLHQDDRGKTPLHYLLETGFWKLRRVGDRVLKNSIASALGGAIRNFVEDTPESLKLADNELALPLHIAVLNGAPFGLIQYLVQKDPDAVMATNFSNKTPLHCLLEHGLRNYHRASNPDRKKYIATSLEKSVRLFAFVDDKVLQCPDHESRLGLHVAVANKAPTGLVEMLVYFYPDAVNEKDCSGRSPLLLAIENKAPFPLVNALARQYRPAMNMRGSSPALVATAASNDASLDVLYTLVRRDPSSLRRFREDDLFVTATVVLKELQTLGKRKAPEGWV